jgi:MoaA/NifB/PqqE/SkfB family radical SAM enzyme
LTVSEKIGGGSVKKLRLFANGEPLLNKNILEMVHYAKQSGVAEKLEMTTNGSLLDNRIAENLCTAGMDIINISINGINEKQYKENCRYNLRWGNFIEGIQKLYVNRGECKIFIKYSDIDCTEEEISCFYQTFGDVCDQIFVEKISSSLWPGADVLERIKSEKRDFWGREYIEKKICTSIFTQMVINSQGKVKLCCSDWKSSIILGDLKEESIKNIWETKCWPMQKKFLQEDRGKLYMCNNCNLPEVSSPDSLDDHIEEVLKRYN